MNILKFRANRELDTLFTEYYRMVDYIAQIVSKKSDILDLQISLVREAEADLKLIATAIYIALSDDMEAGEFKNRTYLKWVSKTKSSSLPSIVPGMMDSLELVTDTIDNTKNLKRDCGINEYTFVPNSKEVDRVLLILIWCAAKAKHLQILGKEVELSSFVKEEFKEEKGIQLVPYWSEDDLNHLVSRFLSEFNHYVRDLSFNAMKHDGVTHLMYSPFAPFVDEIWEGTRGVITGLLNRKYTVELVTSDCTYVYSNYLNNKDSLFYTRVFGK